MRDRPDGIALLGVARRVLLDELRGELPESHRFTAHLVANAMAIAARELAAGEAPFEAHRAALAALYQEDRTHGAGEGLDEAVQRLSWWLAAEIRGGRRDGDADVHALLRARAIDRVRQTNPKVLADAGIE